MPVQLNHTILWCTDQVRSATFLADVLGLPPPRRYAPFLIVDVSNDVSLDYHEQPGPIPSQHYAFLVSEDEFDVIHGRLRERGLETWADPGRSKPGQINRNDGGRAVYFQDPDGHLLEILTRPYGSGGD